MPQSKTKKLSYQDQKKIWYAKLKKSGFEDIEHNENYLKRYSADLFGQEKGLTQGGGWQAKFAYYQMASTFLNEYKFENNTDKIVWMYHSEGISYRDIAKILNKLRKKKVTKMVPEAIIQRLTVIMKKMYLIGYKGE